MLGLIIKPVFIHRWLRNPKSLIWQHSPLVEIPGGNYRLLWHLIVLVQGVWIGISRRTLHATICPSCCPWLRARRREHSSRIRVLRHRAIIIALHILGRGRGSSGCGFCRRATAALWHKGRPRTGRAAAFGFPFGILPLQCT